MAVENITTVPLPVTESSVAVVVKLLSFDEEQLLSLAKTHLVTGMFPQISITALKKDPSLSVSMGFSLVAFFRERAARPAGKQFAKLLRASTQDGGYNICKKLNYCNEKKAIEYKIAKAQKTIFAKVGLDQIGDELEEIEQTLRETLGDEIYEIVESIVEYLSDIAQWITENMSWLAESGAPILTPISLLQYLLIYSLDDLCQCDEKPEDRKWPKC